MDLGDALYRAVCRRSPNTEPQTFGDALAWFVARAGSVSGAARLAGVPRRSMRDWLDGKSTPKWDRRGEVLSAARALERRSRLKPGREKRLRALDPANVSFKGTYNYSGPERDVAIGAYLNPDAINNVIDAYLSGAGTEAMRYAFAESIDDPSNFYPNTLANSENHDHGWSIASIDLEGKGSDDE